MADDKPWLWKPGQSGNPKGRPPGGVSLLTAMQRRLRENPEIAEQLVSNVIELALAKDHVGLKAFQEIINRIDGAIVKQHKVTGDVSLSKLVQLEGDAGDPEAGEDAVEGGSDDGEA